MTRRPSVHTVALTLFLGVAGIVAFSTWAGPLDPPAGSVAPTYKTLTEVEPRIAISTANTPGDADSLFKITQRGSYYLTGNITGVVGKHGIEIAASGVTLDLNGFDLVMVLASLQPFDGVNASGGLRNVTVVNGSVRNWPGDGVDLSSGAVINCRIANVLSTDNTGDGIRLGHAGTISGCSASYNDGVGIFVPGLGTVTGCVVVNNAGNGITTGAGCMVSGCVSNHNTANGISTGDECTVTDCTVLDNVLDGIRCFSNSLIRGNTCTSNGLTADGAGIHASGNRNRIEGNNCTQADRGIDVDAAGNIIVRNTCSGNLINWAIAANNVYGPIINRSAIATAAVNGSSATDTTASTHPNANFSY